MPSAEPLYRENKLKNAARRVLYTLDQHRRELVLIQFLAPALLLLALPCVAAEPAIRISVDTQTGNYRIQSSSIEAPVIVASPAVHVKGNWVRALDYPVRTVERRKGTGPLGETEEWTVRYSGLPNAPELVLEIRAYINSPFGEIQLTARNSSVHLETIEGFRVLEANAGQIPDLGADPAEDRVLSDSFSEDRPAMQIRELNDAENQVHRAVGSQLIYNRKSRQGWFVGALTSDKFLTVIRLHMADVHSSIVSSYEVESTGTTELLSENSLQDSPPEDRVPLSLTLEPGGELSSERILFGVGEDYHHILETYGRVIRELHHARVKAPTPLGWWSWTAYYWGLNQGTALTNAQWLSQNLKSSGYKFFHIDEGYGFARGEYTTPDASRFPDGMAEFESKVAAQGLTAGLWTAPFEVSERSWLFQHHPDWLVKNATGQPIHIGFVDGAKDRLYALDSTHPEAQQYLRDTYVTLVHKWGIRLIKLDFMEDSAVEGYYYVPNTTALEAQRVGLRIIREAVGNDVLLDKDGCELLNPVGIVDAGRISQDTGHTFSSSREAAPGIAARYYMNRNYFLADPDSFSVSNQVVSDQSWHNSPIPLTLDEAKVSIALSTISGGMFEIGDDLPTLGQSPERLALVQNSELIDMALLGRASTSLDLMSYAAEDLQPSLFLLKEDERQSIVTIFNWTETQRSHRLNRADLGLDARSKYSITEILSGHANSEELGAALEVQQPRHSVRMFKIVNKEVSARAPSVIADVPPSGGTGQTLVFHAQPANENEPVLHYSWDFGDGVRSDGPDVVHAYTHPGNFTVLLSASGLSHLSSEQKFEIKISGAITTGFSPEAIHRYVPTHP